MPNLLQKWILFGSIMACGARNESAKLSQNDFNPANAPVRSDCLAWDAAKKRTVAVDWDDQASLRVCMILQNDGALGFDLRLRTSVPEMRRQALQVELKNPVGGSSVGVFPLVWNPFNGIYELKLSQGCLIGTPGGCAESAPLEMRRLFDPLPRSEAYWHPDVQLTVSLLNPQSKSQANAPHFVFSWNASSIRDPENRIN